MAYTAHIRVPFSSPRHLVYETMTDLGKFPMWISGMVRISHTGRMTPGLRYHTENMVLGSTQRYELLVSELEPDRRIVLVSESGAIALRADYQFRDAPDGGTEVICDLHFAFQDFVVSLARPVIESMATARVQSDLETLNLMLAGGGFGILDA